MRRRRGVPPRTENTYSHLGFRIAGTRFRIRARVHAVMLGAMLEMGGYETRIAHDDVEGVAAAASS